MIKAELIDRMGSDLTVVNAARVSFDKESDWLEDICDCDPMTELSTCTCTEILSTGDKRLISYLARHNHFTPFTHCMITLRETVPIFVARQRFKHTVGFTYNEVSRRYVDDEPQFYIPDEWRERAQDKKQGSGGVYKYSDYYTGIVETTYSHLMTIYTDMILDGIAPEQARMVLPQSMMTSYYVTGSLAAFARAYKLRIAPDSQKEIQDLAKQWNEIIEPLYPESWKALIQ